MQPKPLLAAALVAFTAMGCSGNSADGDFGAAKPVKNDGMVTKPGAVEAGAPDWANSLTIVPTYDASTSTLQVVLKIKEGFHAYGAGEEIGKPVAVTVDAVNGWAVDGVVDVPAGRKADLGTMGPSIVLEGEVSVKAKLSKGSGGISGVVEAQICTDTACDRPKKHPFTVPG